MDDFNNKTSIDPFDRRKGFKRLSFKASDYLGHHELNHIQSIQKDAHARLGAALLSQGFISTGGNAIKGEVVDGFVSFRMEAAEIWLAGSMQDVEEAVINLPSTGTHSIGIRLVRFTVDASTDPILKGMAPGTRAEGETMAKAEGELCSWGWDSDGQDGEFYPIYQIKDGELVKETPSSQNDAWSEMTRLYDREAHGHYIVEGCNVTAIELTDAGQVFSISEGTANVYGYKNPRSTSSRITVPEEPDIEYVDSESHMLTGSAPFIVELNNVPLMVDANHPLKVQLTRQKAYKMVHGAYEGVSDGLPDLSVSKIISVKQNNVTYTEGADYLLKKGSLDWSPKGSEPAPGSSYDVVYWYTETVTPDDYTDTSITISDAVADQNCFVHYHYKLPRYDAIAMNKSGGIEYIKGVSSRLSPQSAYIGGQLLRLADIINNWGSRPTVKQAGIKTIPVEQERLNSTRLANLEIQIAELRLNNDISSREPVAKRGLFSDPLLDDTYRDQGTSQTAAVFAGIMTLPILATTEYLSVPEQTIPYEEDIIIDQPIRTRSEKINPYQAFPAPVATARLYPATDIWSESVTEYTSTVTQRFITLTNTIQSKVRFPAIVTTSTSASDEIVGTRTEAIESIRQRDVKFTLSNFGPGEELTSITFDGVEVLK